MAAKVKLAVVAMFVLFLGACGGRVSNPVASSNDFDDQLSCDQLRGERLVNDSRIQDLTDEKLNARKNDIGLMLSSPFILDLSNSEEKEIEAFQKRNKVLDRMIVNRCEAASTAGPQRAVRKSKALPD